MGRARNVLYTAMAVTLVGCASAGTPAPKLSDSGAAPADRFVDPQLLQKPENGPKVLSLTWDVEACQAVTGILTVANGRIVSGALREHTKESPTAPKECADAILRATRNRPETIILCVHPQYMPKASQHGVCFGDKPVGAGE